MFCKTKTVFKKIIEIWMSNITKNAFKFWNIYKFKQLIGDK